MGVKNVLGELSRWILVHLIRSGKRPNLAQNKGHVAVHLRVGREGEDHVEEYLRKRGWRILERNHRNFAGEIDVIAKTGGLIVFVEVKSQHARGVLGPEVRVSHDKVRRLRRAAQYWLDHHAPTTPARIDVVSVSEGQVTAHYEGVEGGG